MFVLAIAVASFLIGIVQSPMHMGVPCPSTELSDIQGRREEHGKVVFLFGDSIIAGWSLASFTPPTDHPLWCLRSPGSVLSTLRADNALGDFTFVAVNGPELVEPSKIEELIRNGIIRDGDVLVVEDAGEHPHPPQTYLQRLLDVRRAATSDHAVTLVVLTTPDYIDPIRKPQLAAYRWNVQIDGITHNAALRQGATEPIPDTVGHTVLVDWQCHADPVRMNLLQEQGLDIFHDDGIHPNVLGQLQLVGLILDAIGVPVERTQAIEQIAVADIGSLDLEANAKSKTWNTDHALRWVNRLLTQPQACPGS